MLDYCKKNKKEVLDIILFSILSFYLIIFIVTKNNLSVVAYSANIAIVVLFGMFCLLFKHASSRMFIISLIVSAYSIISNTYVTLAIYKNKKHFSLHYQDFQTLLLTIGVLLSLIIISLLCKKYLLRRDFQSSVITKAIILSQSFSVIALSNPLFTKIVGQNNYWPIGTQTNVFPRNLLNYSFVSFLLLFLVYYVIVTAANSILDKQFRLRLSGAISLLLAIIFNYYIQAGITTYGEFQGKYIISGATLFQVVILSLLFLTIFLVSNNFIIGLSLNLFIATAISIVNLEKYKQRNEPLLFSDLKWIREIKFFINYISFWQIIGFILVTIIAIVLVYFLHQRLFSTKIVETVKSRMMLLASIALTFLTILFVFSRNDNGEIDKNIPVLSSVYNVFDIDWYGLTTNARFQSLSFVWLKQLTTSTINKPKNYNQQAIEEIYKKYQLLADDINKKRQNNISDQTVIYILSESFANPNRIKNISLSKDPIPEINHIMESTTGGLMHSDGYGGGTANMEFQSLFGLPKYNFNPTVSILYSDVFPKLKYLPAISNEFAEKNRIALHLANANNYSRKIVYDKLHFSKFIATENTKQKPEHLIRMSSSYSDQSTYQNILDNIDPEQSQFFSVITMQNHGPWYTEVRDINAKLDDLTHAENENLQNYVNLLHLTDGYTKSFLEGLQKIDKEITVVFYGDHLPGFYPEKTFDSDQNIKFLTDYFIWNNKNNPKLDHPYVNSSDFTPLLLEHTNSKVSPYYALLTQVLANRNTYDGTFGKNKNQVTSDLKLIQYDLIEGRGYLRSYPKFFEINNY